MTNLAQVHVLREGNLQDVPFGLRCLADKIEAGEFGDSHNLVWVIDCGDSRIELGLLGASPEGGPTAYLLLGNAMRKLEI